MDQNAARAILQGAFPNNHQEVEEYILEAEHQDGESYWTEKVRSAEDLVEDMKLYLQALDIEKAVRDPSNGISEEDNDG